MVTTDVDVQRTVAGSVRVIVRCDGFREGALQRRKSEPSLSADDAYGDTRHVNLMNAGAVAVRDLNLPGMISRTTGWSVLNLEDDTPRNDSGPNVRFLQARPGTSAAGFQVQGFLPHRIRYC